MAVANLSCTTASLTPFCFSVSTSWADRWYTVRRSNLRNNHAVADVIVKYLDDVGHAELAASGNLR